MKFNPTDHRTPRIGQIHVDIKNFHADPDGTLRTIMLSVKDFLNDDKSIVEIIVTNVKGQNA